MSKETSKVVELIKNSGLSVRRLSKELGIPEQRMYGWMNKGATPGHEDTQKVLAYFGNTQTKKASDNEAVISVLLSRVSELYASKTGRSAVVELQQMKKDAEDLKTLT